eukprot:1763451-Rhodomonas_salina.1
MQPQFQISPHDVTENPDQAVVVRGRSKLGSLGYFCLWTRLDLLFTVNMLARYDTKATPQIEKALDLIFAYLKATKHYALHFRAGKTAHRGVSDLLYGYTDASD